MHRCLEIQEILRMILQYLYDDGNLGTIASIAVTFRGFHVPAIDVLWRSVAFEYLIKCLPTDLWYLQPPLEELAEAEQMLTDEQETSQSEEGDEWQGHQPSDEIEDENSWASDDEDHDYGDSNSQDFLHIPRIRFRRDPVQNDLRSFGKYAAHVRDITYGPEIRGGAVLDGTLLRALDRCLVIRPIFTALRSLTWQMEDEDVHPYISLFLDSELHSLSLCVMRNPACPSEDHLFSLLDSSPRLRILILRSTDDSIDPDGGFGKGPHRLFDALSEAVLDLPCLETLHCNMFELYPKAIRHLASLPNLRELWVGSDAWFLAKAAKRAPSFPSVFPQLLDLKIQGELEGVNEMLSLCRPKRLISFDVFEAEEVLDNLDDVRQLFAYLAGLAETLEGLLIRYKMRTESSACMVTRDVLQVLFVCQNVNKLDIRFPVDLTDATLHELAKSLPKLRELRLGKPNHLPGVRSTVTLQGLIPFALYCPALEDLSVLTHASLGDPAAARKFKPDRRGSHLKYLDLQTSSIPDGVESWHIAAFIYHLFPDMRGFIFEKADDPDDAQAEEWYAQWAEVKAAFPKARKILAKHYIELKKKEDLMFQTFFNPNSESDYLLHAPQHLTWLDEWHEPGSVGSSTVPGPSSSSQTDPLPLENETFLSTFLAEDAWYYVDGMETGYEDFSTI